MKDAKNTNGNGNGNTTIYSPAKVADIMEVKKSFVMRLLRQGQLKGFKMGKFWRISDEHLNSFIASMHGNGNGKKRMSADTKYKIRFHATLKSQDTLPKTVEEIEGTILSLKDDLQKKTGLKKIVTIAKLQSAVTLREQLKAKLGSMDSTLEHIGSKAYPKLIGLANKDADALEILFEEDANANKKRMVDYIDKDALEVVKGDGEGEKEMDVMAEMENA